MLHSCHAGLDRESLDYLKNNIKKVQEVAPKEALLFIVENKVDLEGQRYCFVGTANNFLGILLWKKVENLLKRTMPFSLKQVPRQARA